MSRSPWWTRSVRSDFITLTLTDLQIHSSTESRAHHLARHEIQCRRLLLTYTEADSDVPVEIGVAQADEKAYASLPQDGGFGLPRMVVTIYPTNLGGPLDDSSEGEPESSLDDTLEHPPRHQPSPFSSKRVIHESDTPHSESHSYAEKDDSEHRWSFSSTIDFYFTRHFFTFRLISTFYLNFTLKVHLFFITVIYIELNVTIFSERIPVQYIKYNFFNNALGDLCELIIIFAERAKSW